MNQPSELTPQIVVAASRTWENWHQSVKQKVVQRVSVWNRDPVRPSIPSYNATTAALQGLIRDALARGVELRAAGGGWSFSPVAATDGIVLNTLPLNYRFWLSDADLDPAWHGVADRLIFSQCGMSIAELSTALEQRGKSLTTSGASNGQTIAGAIGTGTHGSALEYGAIHDSVVALHLVTSPDRHIWLERASRPVAAASFVEALGAEFVADDDLFNAALVSLGSFGIVHGVMLEVEDLFWLRTWRRQYVEDEHVRAAVGRLDFSGLPAPPGIAPGTRPYFFQAIYNPYDRDGGPYLSLMYDHAADPGGPRPPRHDRWRPGDGAAELIAAVTDLSGGTLPPLGNLLVRTALPAVNGDTGTWGEVFWDTATRGRSAGLAFGIPLSHALTGVDLLHELNRDFRIPGVFALRYVRASPATLAFTRHADMTCVLEIDGSRSKRMLNLYDAAPPALAEAGIPFTLHWGKMHSPTPQLLRDMYGAEPITKWQAARRSLLPTAELRRTFSNRFLADCGLAG